MEVRQEEMVRLAQESRVFGETGKRQSPTPKSETNGATSRESELLVGEAKDRAPAGDYPPAMGWRGAPISALLGLVGQN